MHTSFESLTVTSAPGLHASLMDIHHNTALRSSVENDSISLTSKAYIRSCSRMGARLWLVTRPSNHSFHIAHFIFTSTLCFHLIFIQPSASSLVTCKCGHKLDAFSKHLVHCPFGGQQMPHMTPSKMSCMPLLKRMGTLYGENGDMPLHQEFHYKSIFTWP